MKNRMNESDLEIVAGGAGGSDEIRSLNNFETRTVANLPAGTVLKMQSRPNGPAMTHSYNNGDPIMVNKTFTDSGYLLAYKGGVYGYVDSKYVI